MIGRRKNTKKKSTVAKARKKNPYKLNWRLPRFIDKLFLLADNNPELVKRLTIVANVVILVVATGYNFYLTNKTHSLKTKLEYKIEKMSENFSTRFNTYKNESNALSELELKILNLKLHNWKTFLLIQHVPHKKQEINVANENKFNAFLAMIIQANKLYRLSDFHVEGNYYLEKSKAEMKCLINWNAHVYQEILFGNYDSKKLKNLDIPECQEGIKKYTNFCYLNFQNTNDFEISFYKWDKCISLDLETFLKNRKKLLIKDINE